MPASESYGAPAPASPAGESYGAPAPASPAGESYGAPAASAPASDSYGGPSTDVAAAANSYDAPANDVESKPAANEYDAPSNDVSVGTNYGGPSTETASSPAQGEYNKNFDEPLYRDENLLKDTYKVIDESKEGQTPDLADVVDIRSEDAPTPEVDVRASGEEAAASYDAPEAVSVDLAPVANDYSAPEAVANDYSAPENNAEAAAESYDAPATGAPDNYGAPAVTSAPENYSAPQGAPENYGAPQSAPAAENYGAPEGGDNDLDDFYNDLSVYGSKIKVKRPLYKYIDRVWLKHPHKNFK